MFQSKVLLVIFGKCTIVDIDEEFNVYVSLSHIRLNQNMHNRFLNYIIGTDMFKKMVSLDIDYAGMQGNLNVADKQAQIEKMENYKKSLIYEYVTGKKRVRV